MNITKYGHACLLLEENKNQLLIDPGEFTKEIPELTNPSAIIITHVHFDHIDVKWLKQFQAIHPTVPVYTTQEVVDRHPDITFEAITKNQIIKVDQFSIECRPGDHALVHESLPLAQNLTILVNDILYYPGDSLTLPGKEVEILACPTDGPWLKTGEMIDFIKAIRPKHIFPTHNALNSEFGEKVANNFVAQASETAGSKWQYLKPGDQFKAE